MDGKHFVIECTGCGDDIGYCSVEVKEDIYCLDCTKGDLEEDPEDAEEVIETKEEEEN